MLARLLFAAVALPLIGALPDAHASRAAASRGESAPAISAMGTAPAACAAPALPIAGSAPARRAR